MLLKQHCGLNHGGHRAKAISVTLPTMTKNIQQTLVFFELAIDCLVLRAAYPVGAMLLLRSIRARREEEHGQIVCGVLIAAVCLDNL